MENLWLIVSGTLNAIFIISGIYTAVIKGKMWKSSQKKDQKIAELQEREKQEEDRCIERNQIVEIIREEIQQDIAEAVLYTCEQNLKNFITKEESNERDKELKEILLDLQKTQTNFLTQMRESEKKNIRYIITSFADEIRNGDKKAKTSFQAVLGYYDYYKNHLKGNSFVDDEVLYIKEKMKEVK